METTVSERRRRELYVGTFPNSFWSPNQLKTYFHHKTGRNSVVDCKFHPCGNERKKNHLFAILTFESVDDVDRCMEQCEDIRLEHHLIIKRNLKDRPKHQRALTEHVYISLKQFDSFFTAENVSNYFCQYGKVLRIDSFDNQRKYLLTFEHYDSVDRILLDQPHTLHDQRLFIEKCYEPPSTAVPPPQQSNTEPISPPDDSSRLQNDFDLLKESTENQLDLLRDEWNRKIAEKRKEQLETIETFLRLRCDERELNEKLSKEKQIRDDFKEKIRSINMKNAKLRQKLK